MNLSELRSWIELQSLVPYDHSQVDGYINQAYRELSAAHDWPWLETTSVFEQEAGTPEYGLPADLNRLIAVIYTDQGAEAQPQRTSLVSVLTRFGNNVGESSLPPEYYRQGSNLVFVPTPSSTQEVVLVYQAQPAALAGDEDEPVFDSAFHVYLAQSAIALYLESEESYEHAAYYHGLARDIFFNMVNFYDMQLPGERLIIGHTPLLPRPKPYDTWPE